MILNASNIARGVTRSISTRVSHVLHLRCGVTEFPNSGKVGPLSVGYRLSQKGI